MKKTYRARGLTLELDSDQIFPEDPGQGTPAMVYSGIHSGTFHAAMETGELDGGDFLLSQGQQQWLVDQEDNVNEFIDMYSPKQEDLQIKPRSFAEEVKVDEAKPEPRRSDKPLKAHQDTADKFLETREAIDQLNQQIAAVKAIIGEKESVAGTMAAELMQYAEEYKDRMIRTKNVLIQLEDIPPHKAQVPAYKKVIDHLLEKLEGVSREMRKEAEDFIESAKREIPGSTELKYSKIESVMGEGWKAWYKIVHFFKSIGARIREEIYGIEHEAQNLIDQIQEA